MSGLGVKLVILNSDAEIINEIITFIAKTINKAVRSAIPNFKPGIAPLITNLLTSAPEYQSLLTGRLKDEFGMTTPDVALAAVIKAVLDSITIEYTDCKVSGDTVNGLLTLSLLRSDYADVIPFQILAGTPIPWLEWLLKAGDSVVIANYTVTSKASSATSRAGNTIMIKSGEGYRVPSEFAGTDNNNWLTRSLIGIESEIGKVMETEINRKF